MARRPHQLSASTRNLPHDRFFQATLRAHAPPAPRGRRLGGRLRSFARTLEPISLRSTRGSSSRRSIRTDRSTSSRLSPPARALSTGRRGSSTATGRRCCAIRRRDCRQLGQEPGVERSGFELRARRAFCLGARLAVFALPKRRRQRDHAGGCRGPATGASDRRSRDRGQG